MHLRAGSRCQALYKRGVLMRVGIVVMLIALAAAGKFFFVLMTGIGVRPMAVIRRRHLRHIAAIAHKAAMQPKHLRPQHRRKGEQGESGMKRGAHRRGGYRPALKMSNGISFTDSASAAWPRCG